VAIEVAGRSGKLPFQSHQKSLTRFGASEPRFQLGWTGPSPQLQEQIIKLLHPHPDNEDNRQGRIARMSRPCWRGRSRRRAVACAGAP
jgi:hypothetical protein